MCGIIEAQAALIKKAKEKTEDIIEIAEGIFK